MLVQDVMRKEITLFTPETTFKEAVLTFVDQKMDSTAVVESRDSKKLIGVISLHDLIAKMVPDYLEADPTAASFETAEFFKRSVLKVADLPIGSFMTKEVHVAHANHTLIEVATLMAKYNLRSVPIVNEQTGEIVGYSSRREIKEAMAKVLQGKV